MNPGIRPLLSALHRSPVGPVLIGMQIAITLAVLVNVTAIVTQRVRRIDRPAGIDTRDTFVMAVSSLSKTFGFGAAEASDLAYLRSLPGVAAATVTTGEPLTRDGSYFQFSSQPHQRGNSVTVGILPTDDQGLKTLDVPLIAGRNFRATDVTPFSRRDPSPPLTSIILTKRAAHTLFPRGSAVGKTIYGYGVMPVTVIGVTRDFMGPLTGESPYDTALIPQMSGQFGEYELLVRARPGQLSAVMRVAKRHIGLAHPDAVILYARTLGAELRRMHANDRNVALLLVAVTAVMLAICCFGIFGLATFNVSRRTKQIGVRRALGARRRDIAALFLTESALVLAAGLALGSVLALAIGQWLSNHYGEPRLTPVPVIGGIATLCIVGHLAAWQTARRAARVAPSVATRTV